MDVKIHATITIDGSPISCANALPYTFAREIITPINVTDNQVASLATGEYVIGSIELKRKYRVRQEAVDSLARELSRQLIEQLRSRDKLNGWPVESDPT